MRARAYRAAEAIRHSLRNGFTAYSVLSPVIGFLATVACERIHKLDASAEASGPHVFAVRFNAVRRGHLHVHRNPPNAVTLPTAPRYRPDWQSLCPSSALR